MCSVKYGIQYIKNILSVDSDSITIHIIINNAISLIISDTYRITRRLHNWIINRLTLNNVYRGKF